MADTTDLELYRKALMDQKGEKTSGEKTPPPTKYLIELIDGRENTVTGYLMASATYVTIITEDYTPLYLVPVEAITQVVALFDTPVEQTG